MSDIKNKNDELRPEYYLAELLKGGVRGKYAERYKKGVRFMSSINTDSPPEVLECTQEMRWLKEHRAEYIGQWVALDGDRLLAHGTNSREVREAARKSGIELPLVVQVEAED